MSFIIAIFFGSNGVGAGALCGGSSLVALMEFGGSMPSQKGHLSWHQSLELNFFQKRTFQIKEEGHTLNVSPS